MTAIKSLWASVQGDPTLMRRVNGWLTVFWVAMIPVSMIAGWLSSVVYVSALSLWALVSGHWSAWQAARVEVNQQRAEREAAEADLSTEVADQVIVRTGLAAASRVRRHRNPVAGRADAAPPTSTAAIAAARELIMNRCGLDADQALTFLANTATLSELAMGDAARRLLATTTPEPPPTALLRRVISGSGQPPDEDHQPNQPAGPHPRGATRAPYARVTDQCGSGVPAPAAAPKELIPDNAHSAYPFHPPKGTS